MIPYKQVKYRDLTGEAEAVITSVEIEENQYYDESKDNSTENVLTVVFTLEEDDYAFPQKFIAPLTGGKGLFQQLMDLTDELPDADAGEFDEQQLVGMPVVITFGKNKKDFAIVTDVRRQQTAKRKTVAPVVKKSKKVEDKEDMPWEK